jgi:hypothetical protein
MIFGRSKCYFSRIISQALIIASLFIIEASYALSYLPCIVHRVYFSIIFHLKRCTLYLIKYGNTGHRCIKMLSLQLKQQIDESVSKYIVSFLSDSGKESLRMQMPFYWSVTLKLDASASISPTIRNISCAQVFTCEGSQKLLFGGFLIKKL